MQILQRFSLTLTSIKRLNLLQRWSDSYFYKNVFAVLRDASQSFWRSIPIFVLWNKNYKKFEILDI